MGRDTGSGLGREGEVSGAGEKEGVSVVSGDSIVTGGVLLWGGGGKVGEARGLVVVGSWGGGGVSE